jgi:hypothetical protein
MKLVATSKSIVLVAVLLACPKVSADECVQFTLPDGRESDYIDSTTSDFSAWKTGSVIQVAEISISNLVSERADEFPDVSPDDVVSWFLEELTIPEIRSGWCSNSTDGRIFQKSITFQNVKINSVSCSSHLSTPCGISISVNKFILGDGPPIAIVDLIFKDSFESPPLE